MTPLTGGRIYLNLSGHRLFTRVPEQGTIEKGTIEK